MAKAAEGPYRVSGCRMDRKGFQNPMVETAYEHDAPLLAEVLGQDRPWEEKLSTATLFAVSPDLRDALRKAEAILSQIQENPDKAMDIVAQGYFGHALVRSRSVLAKCPD